MHLTTLSLLGIATVGRGGPVIEGDCVSTDDGLEWLSGVLSSGSAISCLGHPLQQSNSRRYWGTQFGKNASVVVYPSTTQDVSLAVRAARRSPLGQDFAVVSGGHSQLNASSAYGFVLDLSWLNRSRVVYDFKLDDGTGGSSSSSSSSIVTAIEYQGGATWGQIQTTTNGTGYTAIGARIANVGAGGFSLGGGIGFLAGAYGFASDRLVQVEVVLPSGEVVLATRHNAHADLLWALGGGSGQFGVVTRFWQHAVAEPKKCSLGLYYIRDSDVPRLRDQTAAFFNTNTDPFSVVYYSFGYLPADMSVDPPPAPETYAKRTLLITVHLQDGSDPNPTEYVDAFRDLLSGLDTSKSALIQTPWYSDLVFVGEAAYPYGFRRGFYGAQTSHVDAAYLARLTARFDSYLTEQIRQGGDMPYSASLVVQYMFPRLNGHAPPTNNASAWPHATVGHQTLFTPAYRDARNDHLALAALRDFNQITYDQQQAASSSSSSSSAAGDLIWNYPNYASPGDDGTRVWGANVERLIELKEKYDPACLLRRGLVFKSPGCERGNWGTVGI
ncbi:FAD binding domain protein [Moelleriella libera RCEF 2490]|uniref:FAD binding domain protein n=1 Tax=Moelleriella libera RCEF 2490 TaxID=1081109 RepID=A0A162IK46_9HYPO|nr:FAD binding domain protein [Moelleriella libera RCEF 2490]